MRAMQGFSMRTMVVWVSASLTAAIVVMATILIATASRGETPSLTSSAGPLVVQTIARDLDHPWSLAFLPGGKMLVTERPGRMRVVSPQGALSPPLAGVPEVWARGQGGLLDVCLHPDFARNRLLYLSYAGDGSGGAARASTTVHSLPSR